MSIFFANVTLIRPFNRTICWILKKKKKKKKKKKTISVYILFNKFKFKYKDVSSPLIPNYNSVFLRANPKTPGYERTFHWCSLFVFLLPRIVFIPIYHFSKISLLSGIKNVLLEISTFFKAKWEGSKTSCFWWTFSMVTFSQYKKKKKKKKKNVPGCPSWWFYHVIKEESKRTFQIIFLIGILLPYMVISILMLKLLDYLSLIMSSIMRLLATHINKTSVCTSLLWYFWS